MSMWPWQSSSSWGSGLLSNCVATRLTSSITRNFRTPTLPSPMSRSVRSPLRLPRVFCRWPYICGSSSRALSLSGGTDAFRELLDYPAIKRGYIVWLSAGYQTVVRDHFAILPAAAGVADIRLQGWPGRQLSSPDQVRFHQHPRPVANRRNELAGFGEPLHKLHRPYNGTQLVGIRHAAGKN